MSSGSRRTGLIPVYAVVSVVALIGTWRENIAFGMQPDNGGFMGFINATSASAPARSIGIDLAMLTLAAIIFMVVESRRLGIRHVWIYIVLSLLIAVSAAFPLFLIARERKLARHGAPEAT